MTYEQPDAEFYGTTCSLTGTAVYDVRVEYCFDKDIGGRDGYEVTWCELLHVRMDGETLSRDFIAAIIGKQSLALLETTVSETIQQQLDAGDLLAAE